MAEILPLCDPLPPEDARALAEYEQTIAQGLTTFVEVGQALLAIRDERLYRQTHPTFEGYCRERWGLARNYANKLIAAAEVVENLGTIVPIPTNEAQARPLTALSPNEQHEVWAAAVTMAPHERMTAARVQHVVEEFRAQKGKRAVGELKYGD